MAGFSYLVFAQAVGLVHVAAGGRDGHARRVDAGPQYQPLGYGVAQASIHARAAAVAHRREARAQCGQGIVLGPEGHVGRVQGEALAEAVAAGAGLQVHVAVDEAGQHGAAFEVDNFILGAPGGVACLHGHDAVFFDYYGLLGQQAAAAHVEQVAAVQVGFLGERRRGPQ